MNIFPSSLAASSLLLLNIILIVFLAQRTLVSGIEHHNVQRLRRSLNIALVPLLAVFAMTVVLQISGERTGSFLVAARNEPTTRPTMRPLPTIIVGNAVVTAEEPSVTTATPNAVVVAPTVYPATTTPQVAAAEPTPAGLEQFIADSFDGGADGWLTRKTSTWSTGYSAGSYQLTLSGQANVAVTSSMVANTMQISADVTSARGAAGLVFLSSNPASFYYFLVENGRFSILRHDQDQDRFVTVVDWTEAASIHASPNTPNHLRVYREGQLVRLYANDVRLIEWTIPIENANNQYGFVIVAEDGQGQASFDNLVGLKSVAQ